MNRIESITILKDASAKALYGSKAANGVIVIETKRLTGNQQRITYNGSISLEIPDLTSYDLCNAFEKLEAERLDGVYTNSSVNTQIQLDQLYNSLPIKNRRIKAILTEPTSPAKHFAFLRKLKKQKTRKHVEEEE